MRNRKRAHGRRLTTAVVAAAAGSGLAAAIPAMAETSSPTVSVITLGGSSTVGLETIVPVPSNLAADWIAVGPSPTGVIGLDAAGVSYPTYNGTRITPNNSYSPVGVTVGAAAYVADGTNLLAWSGSEGAITSTVAASTPADVVAMVAGPDGDLYVANNAGTVLTCTPAAPSACTTRTVPGSFGAGTPSVSALASAGGKVWFTDGDGELGALDPSTGAFSGPYDAGTFSIYTRGLTSVAGTLWAIDAANDGIDSLSPASPGTVTPHPVATSAFPTPNVNSVTAGPDGNVWFSDAADNGVGFVNVTSGTVTEYAVPAGYRVYGSIAPGPGGTDSLVFPLRTTGGATAVNLIGQIVSPSPALASTGGGTTPATTSSSTTTGGGSSTTATPVSTPTPSTVSGGSTRPSTTVTPARLTLTATAPVSSRRVATLTLRCAGGGGTSCAGRLTLSLKVTTKVKRTIHGKRKVVTRTSTITLAAATYRLQAGRSASAMLKLSAAAYHRVQAAKGRRLRVIASVTATAGSAPRTTVTLAGAKPSKRTRKG